MTTLTPRSRASRAWTSLRIEPVGQRVDLHGDAGARGGVHHCVHVERVGRPAQQQPPRRVAQHVDVRVGDRLQQARGHLVAILIEGRVDRRDHHIEGGQAVVSEIERPVRADVAFDAREETDAVDLAVERADARRVLERPPFVEPVRHGERLAVIGDRHVVEARGAGAGGHLADAVLAVAFGRVQVQVAMQATALDESRQAVFERRLDFSARFAELGRHPVEAERAIDVLFPLAGDADLVGLYGRARIRSSEARAPSRDRAERCCAPSIR